MPGVSTKNTYNNVEGATNQMVIVAGSFEVNGTGEPTNVRGDGFTVAYDDVGKHIITFAKTFASAQLISFVAGWEDEAAGTADDVLPSSEAFDASTNSITVRMGINSVLTNDDGPRLNFIAVFNKSVTLAKTHT